ncbi:5-(carboxyamino)imidazole ribonucleotide synthase [Flammeovirga yaeyamensis]|uniref:N5-carboxyaminoimidazole ribonucleotide synthase n=1 Tax=Flammeovirga yaeyamensis TaxID=367791 RepID=A0AAX1N5Q0_9BACT|nr:5-(carboxyamino)imidazole ribonucleotide synthase [Flammeovirga yaeyamensis]MBB3698447.1 5-(carboxyamino)imidazole ribonucleotide synthase [Flammeovirga yaeyamensis]NMF34203.1 5-(carboxyamino)imidazole ribonucleotide synthase [Flammeovirga yaeyamensis]QWG01188.1 5-(carboxyamino)imidazole ribonucleotide synthase [Flammeovirga yaeyamensis]
MKKVGVLGGGQLGRMMIQSAMNLNIQVKTLDPDPNAPCKATAHEFVVGSLNDYDTVMEFAKDIDVLTIEIENVNTDALFDLEKQGLTVYPKPDHIKMIQDKRVQKQFYIDNDIPTSPFVLIDSIDELNNHKNMLPAVMKVGKGGYDGRGVQVMKTEEDFSKGFEAPSLLEKMVDIDKEIAIIAARNENGEISTFPAVEVVYHESNLVDYLLSPATISDEVEQKAKEIATSLVTKMNFIGLLAIEFFVDKEGNVIVNEIAPRTHNSGHQTIEGNLTSQFDQHIRAILNLPLGDTSRRSASAMVNVLGEKGYTGVAKYEGLNEVLQLSGVYIHLYEKHMTKPERKMGHITIVAPTKEELFEKVDAVKKNFKVIA